MYCFKENLPLEEFQNFIFQNMTPIQQTEAWAKVKNGWQSHYFGLYKNETLCGVALVLVRKLLPAFSYAYCPRGPVMDFSDKEAVIAFKKGIEAFCKKRGIYSFTTDPLLPVGKTLPELQTEAFLDIFDIEKGKEAHENMLSAGFSHGGFSKELHSTLQPRFNAMIPLKKADGTSLTFEELKKNYKTKIRKYYANFQAARGLYFEKSSASESEISLFKKVLSSTEERQKISLRGEEYFSLMAKSLKEKALFSFEKTDINKYIENLEARLIKESENAEKITAQIAEAKEIAGQNGNNPALSAQLTIFPPNEKGIKIAEYLYAGSNLKIFPSFSATLCALGDICKVAIEKDIDYLNLGGLSGNFDDGLYDFKKQFSPIIVEFSGEYTLKIKKIRFAIMQKGLPFLQRVYKKIRRR